MKFLGLDALTSRFWLLGLAQAAHSLEEIATRLYDFFWIATGRLREVFPGFAQVRMSAQTFGAINLALVAVLLGVVPLVRARKPFALALAAIAGVVEIANGIGHVAGAVWFRGYVPGVATAPLLFVAGVSVLRELARSSRVERRPV